MIEVCAEILEFYKMRISIFMCIEFATTLIISAFKDSTCSTTITLSATNSLTHSLTYNIHLPKQ